MSEEQEARMEPQQEDAVRLGSVEIHRIMPYRYPFLLIDLVLSLEGTTRIVALKNVSSNEEFFQGHFPGRPIMPGLLIVEAMAQAAALMVLHGGQSGPLYLVGVNKFKINRPVVPGDRLLLEVNTILLRDTMGKVLGQATVDGEQVAQAEITFAVPPPPVEKGGERS